MSQAELARRLNVSRSAVNAWENDRAYPQNSIGALEHVLGISLTDGNAPPPPREASEGELDEAISHARETLNRLIAMRDGDGDDDSKAS
jgi:ribosome-binding protein aMBF1 (putative translation factor)